MRLTVKDVRNELELRLAKRREALLVDVANLEDCDQFWRRWDLSLSQKGQKPRELFAYGLIPREQASNAELLEMRDRLRDVWDRRDGAPVVLQEWLRWSNEKIPAFIVSQGQGVMPNPTNLRFQLVLGICELDPKLAHCQAEGCPAPYFVRYRDERQRFCDREECLAFGQRLHKREWAKRSREEQRLKAAGKKRRKNT